MPTRTLQRIIDITDNGGKALANSIFPNEFEYYAVTLELVDSEDQTVDFLTFPVTPNAIDYSYNSIVNVKKNMGGVTAIDSSTFVPSKYNMSGSFGRNLKILVGRDVTHQDSTQQGNFGIDTALQITSSILNSKIKSGYGTIKVLEAIVKKSSQLDAYNRPHRLYLYNPALGHSFLVKVMSWRANQDYNSSNMVWQYDLQMITILPLESVSQENENSLASLTVMPFLQRGANHLFNTVKQIV